MTDTISKKTRQELREYFVGTTLRHISEEFDTADIPINTEYVPAVGGQRRSLVEQYYHTLDFTSWRDVRKFLRVYESALQSLEDLIRGSEATEMGKTQLKILTNLKRCLERDGFVYSNGTISSPGENTALQHLEEASKTMDTHVLRQQTERIRTSIDDDPDLAIGTSKELLETVCKTILADYGITPDSKWDVIRLSKETRAVLKLVPEDIPESAKGADTIKRILGNLAQVSQGIAELRNLYGTGHGKDNKYRGLSGRHARLAVSCATALAAFFLETHEHHKRATI
jgi:hypothetical protein